MSELSQGRWKSSGKGGKQEKIKGNKDSDNCLHLITNFTSIFIL